MSNNFTPPIVTTNPDGGTACQTGGAAPYETHRTAEEFTEPTSCAGCPGTFSRVDALETALAPGATTVRVRGTIDGQTGCEWFVLGGTCGVTRGTLGFDPDNNRSFDAVLPVFCGTNVVQLVCTGTSGQRVLVRTLEGAPCASGGSEDLRVTLTWDERGRDLELHLVRDGGHINDGTNDCTWNTCRESSSNRVDWGTPGDTSDDPSKDADDLDTLGPENIYLSRAPAGRYHVIVEHYGSSGEPSTADVDVIVHGVNVGRQHITDFRSHHVWNVGYVEFPSGRFTPTGSTFDCNAGWSSFGGDTSWEGTDFDFDAMGTGVGCSEPLP